MATLLPSIRNSFSLFCSTIGGEKSEHRGKLDNECQRFLFLIQSQLVGFGVNPHDSSTGHSESSIHPHMAPTRGLKLMSHRLHPIHKGLLFGLYTTAFKFVSCPLFFFFNGWDSILKFWVFALLAKSEEVNIMVKIRRLSRSSLLLPMGGYFPVSHSLYSSFLSVRPNIHLLCSSGSWMHLILLPLTLSNVSEGKQGSWKSKSPSFNSFLCRLAWNFMFPYRHPCKTIEGPQPSLWVASLPPTELNWRTRSTSCRKPGSAYTGLSWPRPFLHMIGWATKPVPFPWLVIGLGMVMSGELHGNHGKEFPAL